MAEKVVSYTIEVRGTEEERTKLTQLRREQIELTNQIKKLNDATKGNSSAQKAAAGTLSQLESQLKATKAAYSTLEKDIIKNSTEVKAAAGSYNELVQQNNALVKSLNAMPNAFDPANKAVKDLQTQILQNTNKLKQFDEGIGRSFRNVGNYGKGVVTLTKGLNGLATIGTAVADIFGVDTQALQQLTAVTQELVRGSKEVKDVIEATTIAKKAETTATETQIVVEKEMNTVRGLSALAIGGIIAGLAVLGAAIAVYIVHTKEMKEAEEETQRATDGTIIKNENLREAYNNHILVLREVSNQYKVLSGEMTQAEADADNLEAKFEESSRKIKNTANKELIEATGIVNKLKDSFLALSGQLGASSAAQAKRVSDVKKKEADELKAIEIKKNDDIKKIQTKALEDAFKELEQAVKKEEEEKEKAAKEAERKAKERADKRIENEKRIFDLTRELLQGEVDILGEGLDKQIAQEKLKYDDKIANLKRSIEALKGSTKEEIEIIRLTNERIVQLEQEKNKAIRDLEQSFDTGFDANKALQTLNKMSKAIDDAKRKKKTSLFEELFGLDAKTVELALEKAVELADEIAKNVFDARQDKIDRDEERELESLENQKETRLAIFEDELDKQRITEDQFRLQKEALDREFEEKKLEARKRAFEKEKDLAKDEVLINLALELSEIAVNAAANPVNAVTAGGAGIAQYAILSAAAAAAAAIQLGQIEARTFAEGGLIRGPGTGTSDSILARVSNGEAIMNERSTSMFKPLLSAINVAGGGRAFASGGIPIPSISGASSLLKGLLSNDGMAQFAQTIVNGINSKEVVQSERDVSNIQNKVKQRERSNSF